MRANNQFMIFLPLRGPLTPMNLCTIFLAAFPDLSKPSPAAQLGSCALRVFAAACFS